MECRREKEIAGSRIVRDGGVNPPNPVAGPDAGVGSHLL